jgi:hypothetical protein
VPVEKRQISTTKQKTNLPIHLAPNPVQVFPTLFAKILVGAHRLIHDPDTATMLPNFAGITLDEHAADFV